MKRTHAILATALVLGSPSAFADEPAPATEKQTAEEEPDIPMPPSGRQRLNAALSAYQLGESDTARLSLARIVNDSTITDEALRQEARFYLGEVLYLQQNEEEARRVFEAVLTLDPGYPIDPFAHPPDVCGFFETVRAYIVTPNPVAPVSAGPAPRSAYLGFGIYQIQSGQNRKGTRIATLQAVAGAISLVGFAGLMDDRQYLSGEDALSSLKMRRSIQWTGTAAFYGIWAWSIADAHQHLRSNIRVRAAPPDRTLDGGFGLPTGLHISISAPTP